MSLTYEHTAGNCDRRAHTFDVDGNDGDEIII